MNSKRFEAVARGAGVGALVMMSAVIAGCSGQPSGGGQASVGPQRVAIYVTEDGFQPKTVTVHAGQPVTLVVTRKTERTCATELVMAEENIHQPLPMNQPVEITFTPKQKGDLTYACGMDMVKGLIAVR